MLRNNKNLVETCLQAIDKAKQLKHLNMFITETFQHGLRQAEQSQLRQSNYF